MKLKLLRRGVQIASLLFFVYLLVQTTWPLHAPLDVGLYLRADPLAGLAVALSPGRSWAVVQQFWPALVVLLGAALMGRVYCGWVCPLGTCVDGADALLRRKERGQGRKVGLLVLVGSLAAALLGTHLFWLFDPIPLITRTFATAADPAGRWLYNLGVIHGYGTLREAGLRLSPVEARGFAMGLETAVVFLAVLALGLLGKRYWCRNLCPLGALLGLAGKVALWRRRVAESCTSCGRCVNGCPMGAIAQDGHATDPVECIECLDCVRVCPQGSVSFGLGGAAALAGVGDVGRREFLAVGAAGVAYGVLGRWGLRQQDDRLIRPPGAIVRGKTGAVERLMTEGELRAKCLRCGQCMKACPTGGLQPAVGQAGLEGFYTPVLVPRKGWCEQNFAACGLVCPSGALTPFAIEEKKRIRIGEARIDHDRCLAWGQGEAYRECLVCNEHCSYGAIRIWRDGAQQRPVVEGRHCVGCGLCEAVCPVKTKAAIVVYRRRGQWPLPQTSSTGYR
ncbi:MAG: 4Fe-4S dicluster domain-containing protein [Armatimonadia bacterium]